MACISRPYIQTQDKLPVGGGGVSAQDHVAPNQAVGVVDSFQLLKTGEVGAEGVFQQII
jgi:hypothetical protein